MAHLIFEADRRIYYDVLQHLQWRLRLIATGVRVKVRYGVVTLTGTVSTYAEKRTVQDAVSSVAGVLDIDNSIHVQAPGGAMRTDAEIARAVREALDEDALLPQENIRFAVVCGWVTLERSVPSWTDRRSAERSIRRLRDVQGVTNDLTVLTPRIPLYGLRGIAVRFARWGLR